MFVSMSIGRHRDNSSRLKSLRALLDIEQSIDARHKRAEPESRVSSMRYATMKAGIAMKSCGIALALVAATGLPAFANGMDQMANNLESSCSNHFHKRPNRPSNDSRKYCSCFAGVFTSSVSLRDLDLAAGVLTPEIQEQFQRAADICSQDVAPDVAQSGKAWATQTN